MDQKKIGAFLKTLRTEKGLTQEQLAEQFHVSSRTVSRWETGSNMPDISLLAPLADFYDVDVREIMEGVRKSEMMNEELKDVAVKMADYAGAEKGRLFKWVQVIGFVGVGLLTIAIVFQCINYEPNFLAALGIFLSFLTLIALAVTTFYANGVLGKLVKKKAFVIVVRIVTIVLIVISARFILAMGLVVGLGLFETFQPFKNFSGIENYDKQAILENYGGDLDSSMRLFPDSVDGALDATFSGSARTGLFDSDAFFILIANYDEDTFNEEIERLSSTEVEIEFKDESVINKVMYDTESYYYPAYVASDGYDSVYEYALIDEPGNRIAYVIISYPDWVISKHLKYRKFFKRNLLEYNTLTENTLEKFSIYSHSFEEGIWLEAD
jgi:transcriptional regulator with XRE-family HTH domain